MPRPIVAPSITAETPSDYTRQLEIVTDFAKRVHIDLADGDFAPRKLISIAQCWWPDGLIADMHLMYRRPWQHWETIIARKPHLVIVHSEAVLEDFLDKVQKLHEFGIKIGLALLKETDVDRVPEEYVQAVDHVLIFSGDLGYYGGQADMTCLQKVPKLQRINSGLEIGWDGGVSPANAKTLADAGISVLVSGGYIQHADNPQVAYEALVKAT